MDLDKTLLYFKTIGTFLTIMKNAKSINGFVKDIFTEHVRDVNEIFDEVINEKRNIGDFISLEGYLLKYGQVFKPYTNINSVWKPASEKDVSLIQTKNNISANKMDFYFERNRTYLPAQYINPLNNIGCAFVYDSRFKGFARNKDLSLNKHAELVIEDNKYAKPMLVLYDTTKHLKYLNKKVCLKGKICKVPQEIAESLNITYDDNIREICSNFYRPYNENVNMICLSLLDDKSKISFADERSLYDNFEDLNIPIFLEAELTSFQNLEDKVAIEMIDHIIPNSVGRKLQMNINPLTLRDEIDKAVSFPTTDEIQIIYRNPGAIGFYTTASLIDNEKYAKSLYDLSRYINNFSVDYKNLTKKNFGKKEKLNINFLFDYDKKDLFNSKYIQFRFDNKYKDIKTQEILDWLGKKL